MTFTQFEWLRIADDMGREIADVTLQAKRIMTRGEYKIVLDRATQRLSVMLQERNVPSANIEPILSRLSKSFEARLQALGQSIHRFVGRA